VVILAEQPLAFPLPPVLVTVNVLAELEAPSATPPKSQLLKSRVSDAAFAVKLAELGT
jgi:hypothetical protein